MIMIGITWLLIGLGIIFILTSVIIRVRINKSRQICTEKIQASVVELEERKVRDMDHQYSYTTFYPTYRYEYAGHTYARKGTVGYPENRIMIGQNKYIYVNPEDPLQIRDDTNIYSIAILIFTLVGVILLIAGIALRFLLGQLY